LLQSATPPCQSPAEPQDFRTQLKACQANPAAGPADRPDT
jgi:hypothetical protein